MQLSPVPAGWTAAITGSTDTGVIALDGKITPVADDTDVTLTITLSRDDDPAATADKQVTVTVPASPKAADVAAGITQITAPAKDAVQLDFPAVPQGVSIAISKSSHPDIIAADGTIVPQDTATTVALTLVVTRASDGTEALTDTIMVKIPAKTPVDIPISDIFLSAGEITMQENDAAKQLKVSYLPANTTSLKMVTWTSSNTNAAIVEDGLVTPVGAGQADITAETADGIKATCSVTVKAAQDPEVAVAGVTLDQNNLVLSVGKQSPLKATVLPKNAADKSVSWTSADPKVASVDKNGTVTGIKAGKTRVTVQTTDGNKTAVCQVTVTAPENPVTKVAVTGVILDRSSLALYPGKKAALKARVLPENATNKGVSWVSANPRVATVDQRGNISGVKAGKTTITVTTADGSKKASCEVTIKQYVKKLAFKTPAYTVTKKGQKVRLKNYLTVTPKNASVKAVTWKSSNKRIATVDKNGTVKFKAKKGKVTITAIAKDGSKKKAKITIIYGKKIAKIQLSQTKLTLKRGKSKTIKAKITKPAKPAYKKVVWSSSNPKVATVSSKGKIKALKKGKATITALAGDGSGKKAKVKVTVK